MEEQKRKNQQKAWEKQEKMIKQLKSSGISKTKAEQVGTISCPGSTCIGFYFHIIKKSTEFLYPNQVFDFQCSFWARIASSGRVIVHVPLPYPLWCQCCAPSGGAPVSAPLVCV